MDGVPLGPLRGGGGRPAPTAATSSRCAGMIFSATFPAGKSTRSSSSTGRAPAGTSANSVTARITRRA
jgi:hypothetical protein